jgi:cytochrome c biogenesis protein CcmG/thiol:disulfide interchange protein DsbE
MRGGRIGWIGTLALAACAAACGGGPQWGVVEDRWAGDMDDRSYSGARDAKRPDANGTPASLAEFEGEFLWTDHAAPWCGPCRRQAPVLKALERRHGDGVLFLTIMTSAQEPGGGGASVEVARAWARRHGLDPEMVLAANLWSKTVPEHRFYSPEGQTLLVARGYLPAERISELISERSADWRRWKADGTRAAWMR